ncbi:hypothetical protein BP00DRAFT_428387 [Aspergillus indologenus CBS 114.80]|uniref:Uncharacterized protein n=1 Tax=Aspergillus indologenus CBS 114.80 TaxID=1450541 RepID=A0A2V5IIQ4_9EURO|nr:hypothetical protein BP00DRAFT_428387 [Aspergillus indologenus CBS 114.80]
MRMHQHGHVQWLMQAGQGFLIDTSTDALDSDARGLATAIRILHRSTPKDKRVASISGQSVPWKWTGSVELHDPTSSASIQRPMQQAQIPCFSFVWPVQDEVDQ